MSESENKKLVEKNCERCAMALVQPVFRCASGHEICALCVSEVMVEREEENCAREEQDSDNSEGEYEDAEEDNVESDSFEYVDMSVRGPKRDVKCPESMRPYTVGSMSWSQMNGPEHEISQTDDSNHELKLAKLRPPEHKKSFIDMITGKSGLNISYTSSKSDPEDQESNTSEEVEAHEILEEVFKKYSTTSLDSAKSLGGSLKYKPIVCPLESCLKFVSVSGLITHFKFEHSNIPIEVIACNETVSFFVRSSIIEADSIINEKIFIIDAERQEDSAYFTLNIAKQCFAETAMLLIWVSEIKMNMIHYLYKIQAKNNKNDRGKVVSYFGPVTNHQDPLAVFHNGDCLVIPMTVFHSFKDYAEGFDVSITFSVGDESALVDEEGDAKQSWSN